MAITKQWQVYIPEKIRESLGITQPTQVTAKVEGGKLVITPQKSSLLKLAGKYKHLKPKKKIDLDNIRDAINYSQL